LPWETTVKLSQGEVASLSAGAESNRWFEIFIYKDGKKLLRAEGIGDATLIADL